MRKRNLKKDSSTMMAYIVINIIIIITVNIPWNVIFYKALRIMNCYKRG